jgi:hypothetical protein
MIKFNMTKKHIILIAVLSILGFLPNLHGQEILKEIETPQDIAVLNEELRKKDVATNKVAADLAALDAQVNAEIDALVIPVASSQAEMETATSTTTYVSPGRVKDSPFAAKAWLKAANDGTISASQGITSVNKSGASYTVTFSTAFSSTAYAVLAVVNGGSGLMPSVAISSTTVCVVEFKDDAGSATAAEFSLIAFGDQ